MTNKYHYFLWQRPIKKFIRGPNFDRASVAGVRRDPSTCKVVEVRALSSQLAPLIWATLMGPRKSPAPERRQKLDCDQEEPEEDLTSWKASRETFRT